MRLMEDIYICIYFLCIYIYMYIYMYLQLNEIVNVATPWWGGAQIVRFFPCFCLVRPWKRPPTGRVLSCFTPIFGPIWPAKGRNLSKNHVADVNTYSNNIYVGSQQAYFMYISFNIFRNRIPIFKHDLCLPIF